jgi:hypothetical protein
MHKANERSSLSAELQKQLSELGRSKPYRAASGSFNEIAAIDQKRGKRTIRIWSVRWTEFSNLRKSSR